MDASYRKFDKLELIFTWIFLAIFFCLVPVALSAQMECFTKLEQTAEQIVRNGVRIREGAIGCHLPPFNRNSYEAWKEIDEGFANNFLTQKKIRDGAFIREFSDDAENRLNMWNGRIVYHFRHYPLSDVYCDRIESDLKMFKTKGWKWFVKQAGTGRGEVRMDFMACGKK